MYIEDIPVFEARIVASTNRIRVILEWCEQHFELGSYWYAGLTEAGTYCFIFDNEDNMIIFALRWA